MIVGVIVKLGCFFSCKTVEFFLYFLNLKHIFESNNIIETNVYFWEKELNFCVKSKIKLDYKCLNPITVNN